MILHGMWLNEVYISTQKPGLSIYSPWIALHQKVINSRYVIIFTFLISEEGLRNDAIKLWRIRRKSLVVRWIAIKILIFWERREKSNTKKSNGENTDISIFKTETKNSSFPRRTNKSQGLFYSYTTQLSNFPPLHRERWDVVQVWFNVRQEINFPAGGKNSVPLAFLFRDASGSRLSIEPKSLFRQMASCCLDENASWNMSH